MSHICSDCGSVCKPKKITKGSFLIEILLWLFLLLPGIVYTLWRVTTKYSGCDTCGSKNIVPTSTPRGIQLMNQYKNYQKY